MTIEARTFPWCKQRISSTKIALKGGEKAKIRKSERKTNFQQTPLRLGTIIAFFYLKYFSPVLINIEKEESHNNPNCSIINIALSK